MSGDLVAFLRERLDEDEQVARKAAARRPQIREGLRRWKPDGMSVRDDVGDLVVKHSWPHEIEHIARHDPARVLAEVAAKRAILTQCAEITEYVSSGGMGAEMSDIRERDVLEDVLRLLALPYAEHPGYRSEWAPHD